MRVWQVYNRSCGMLKLAFARSVFYLLSLKFERITKKRGLTMDLKKRFEELKSFYRDDYETVSVERLEDLNSVGLLLKHKKSGARVCLVSNDDNNKVFSIGFKTPPTNDTGTQHIIEHSTLCGSRKYPVKDPFVELVKGSLNTFLNAMTYPDKTVYPVASCNDVDFQNLMDVYMDAVFYPNIYKNPKIFMQEGWHYELESRDSELKYNGVVFNEMKGAFSSADDVLTRHTFINLFPDNNYRNESGGDPEVIPDLTYEDFLQYHKEYYHPVNSFIYLYGDFDINEKLDYLSNEYLNDFERDDVNIDSSIKLQKGFDSPKDVEEFYAISDDESEDNNTYLSYNVVVGTSTDAKLYLAMDILDYALILAPGAPLKQALIDAGIGTDVYSDYESSVYQPIYSIVSKNANAKQKDEFIKVITNTLIDLRDNGINPRLLKAALNYYEFKYRESDYGPYPKGLMYYLNMMDSWLYDENKPFIHVQEGTIFDELKNEISNGYFEKLIDKYLLSNNHKLVLTLKPKKGLDEERRAKEAKRLADYKATLSNDQLDELIKETKELKEYQDTPSSQEQLETIPMLKLDDISKNPEKLYIDKKNVEGVEVIHSNLFTNRIAYPLLSFSCDSVPDEYVQYAGLLSSLMGSMSTENFSYQELTNEININCGGISFENAIYTDNKELGKYSIRFEIKSKALYDKIDFVFNMIEEIINTTKFDDYKRLKEIIARIKSRMEGTMVGAGNTVAVMNTLAQFSESSYYSNKMKGYEYYRFIDNINANFDAIKEDIAFKLKELVGFIFNKNNLVVSFTSDDEGYNNFVAPFSKFVKILPGNVLSTIKREYKPEKVKTGFTSSSQVQYVAMCGNYVKEGYSYTGALKVLKVIFSYDYLWINVRVKGGAYGCGSSFFRNGDMYMSSYRDPNLTETIEIFKEAYKYVENFDVSDRDMLKYIIGTIGDLDTPLNPAAKGVRSFSAYMSHADFDTFVKERSQILNCSVDAIRALAPIVKLAINQDYLSVVGNQQVIQDKKEIFDKVKPLIVSN